METNCFKPIPVVYICQAERSRADEISQTIYGQDTSDFDDIDWDARGNWGKGFEAMMDTGYYFEPIVFYDGEDGTTPEEQGALAKYNIQRVQ